MNLDSDILEIRELNDSKDVNRALKLNWKLLSIQTKQTGEGGLFSKELRTNIIYIVGRSAEGIPDPNNWIEYPSITKKPRKRKKN